MIPEKTAHLDNSAKEDISNAKEGTSRWIEGSSRVTVAGDIKITGNSNPTEGKETLQASRTGIKIVQEMYALAVTKSKRTNRTMNRTRRRRRSSRKTRNNRKVLRMKKRRSTKNWKRNRNKRRRNLKKRTSKSLRHHLVSKNRDRSIDHQHQFLPARKKNSCISQFHLSDTFQLANRRSQLVSRSARKCVLTDNSRIASKYLERLTVRTNHFDWTLKVGLGLSKSIERLTCQIRALP